MGAEVADHPVEAPKPALTLPNKPSIAVLPIANLSILAPTDSHAAYRYRRKVDSRQIGDKLSGSLQTVSYLTMA
jgi:hypothetical protein